MAEIKRRLRVLCRKGRRKRAGLALARVSGGRATNAEDNLREDDKSIQQGFATITQTIRIVLRGAREDLMLSRRDASLRPVRLVVGGSQTRNGYKLTPKQPISTSIQYLQRKRNASVHGFVYTPVGSKSNRRGS
ncbi:hypothetical protein BV22DRAFT_128963 [Leucogyrophana mollusca]|uniref:Uncharacterized protein n=1 Tax=Leucogyrophana mollusca TaxID=85980 RepID=A0ACB8BXW2_9AGAM|nr:hypothetical protein BV22DRAFT_128963 [Leucogyrophana mollusca]